MSGHKSFGQRANVPDNAVHICYGQFDVAEDKCG
jgi:hypothetical protein